MRIEDIADNDVHMIPRIRVRGQEPACLIAFIIAWRRKDNIQKRHMASQFLARRWAREIAQMLKVDVIEHFIMLE